MNMASPATLLAVIGLFYPLPTNAAPVEHDPINIIINENFKTQPSFAVPRWPYFVPNTAHHGAHFYFNPHHRLPSNHLTYYTGLMSPVHHYPIWPSHNTNSKLQDGEIKVTDTAKLLAHLLTEELSHLEKKTKEKQHFKESFIIQSEQQAPTKKLVLMEMPEITKDEILEDEMIDLSSISGPEIIDGEELEFDSPEIAIFPALPELSSEVKPIMDLKETNNAIVMEDTKIQELVLSKTPVAEEFAVQSPLLQPTVTVKEETKPHVSEFVIIPEPEPSFDTNPVSFVDNSEIEDPSVTVFEKIQSQSPPVHSTVTVEKEYAPHDPTLSPIPEAPLLAELSFTADPIVIIEDSKIKDMVLYEVSRSTVVEEIMEASKPSQYNIIVEKEVIPNVSQTTGIPEAPVLPDRSVHTNPITIVDDTKSKEERNGPSPSDTVFENVNSSLPFTSPTITEEESKTNVLQTVVIPDAPVLPELSFDNNPGDILADSKIKELILSEVSKQSGNTVDQELSTQSNIIIGEEVKLYTTEPAAIPKAPVLADLSFDTNSITIIADSKINDAILPVELEPTHSETTVEEIQLVPSFTSDTVIEKEPKPHISHNILIPVAPMLPELSFEANPVAILEDSKIKDLLFSESDAIVNEFVETSPSGQPVIMFEDEFKPFPTFEVQGIPEAPVLSFDMDPIATVEDSKIEDCKHMGTFMEVSESEIIPEAPVLPELSFDANPVAILEDPVIKDLVISEVSKPPLFDSIIKDTKDIGLPSQPQSKPNMSEFVLIPDAPALPELKFDTNPIIIVEDSETEEVIPSSKCKDAVEEFMSISSPFTSASVIEEEYIPYIPQSLAMPDAPILPELSLDVNPIAIIEDSKIKELVLSKESKSQQSIEVVEVSPPSQHNIIVGEETKPRESKNVAILPKAPLLPKITLDIVKESKIEESVSAAASNSTQSANVDQSPLFTSTTDIEESEPFVSHTVIMPEAPVLPDLPFDASPDVILEDSKIKDLVLSELSEPTQFNTIVDEKVIEMESLSEPAQSEVIFEENMDLSSFAQPTITIEERFKIHIPEYAVTILEGSKVEDDTLTENDPSQSKITTKEEFNPRVLENLVIPEPPVLPELTFDNNPVNIVKNYKIEDIVLSEESKPSHEKVIIPVQSSVIIEEKNLHNSELAFIPEAPRLPELNFDSNKVSILEESNVQEHTFSQEVFRPIQTEDIVEEVQFPLTKPAEIVDKTERRFPDIAVIPDAPVLSELSFDVNPFVILEQAKVPYPSQFPSEAIKVTDNRGRVIPEAPELPPLSFDTNPAVITETDKLKSSALPKSTKSDVIAQEITDRLPVFWSKLVEFPTFANRPIILEGSKLSDQLIMEPNKNVQHATETKETTSHKKLKFQNAQFGFYAKASIIPPHNFYTIFKTPSITDQDILKESVFHLVPLSDKTNTAKTAFIALEKSESLGSLHESRYQKLFPLIVPKLKNTFGILKPIPTLSQRHSIEPLLSKKFLISNEKLS